MAMFVVAVRLPERLALSDVERATAHCLDTVIVPVHPNNFRTVLTAMRAVADHGWQVRFLLWAKGNQVKSVPLHRFAHHPALLGWVVEQVTDVPLMAMLRATTASGLTIAWQRPIPFTDGTLSPQPADDRWWSWLPTHDPDALFPVVVDALLRGARSVCFTALPRDSDAVEREQLKALASVAVQLRLWQPLLAERAESVDIAADNAQGRGWRLRDGEWLLLVTPLAPGASVACALPFPVPEGVRAYGVRFPALQRFPLQRKGSGTFLRLGRLVGTELVWLTGDRDRTARMHQRADELLPKAMQFAVQWVLARKERIGQLSATLSRRLWQMLQAAKRRQFHHAYSLATDLLSQLR